AAWLVSGTGNATGKAGTLAAPTWISAGSASMTGDLYPGNGAGSLGIATVNNPNPIAVKITGVNKATGTIASMDTANCPSSNFSWGGDAVLSTPVTVPAGSTALITIPANSFPAGTGLLLAANAPTGCQGVGVSLTGFTLNFST